MDTKLSFVQAYKIYLGEQVIDFSEQILFL